jgi:uncharacterized protein
LPGWASSPAIRVNGSPVSPPVSRGYAAIQREWKRGDVVELSLPMEVERLTAHPRVLQAQGKVALRRGPLVYSFEQADNPVSLREVVLSQAAAFKTEFDPNLGGGVIRVTTDGLVGKTGEWDHRLYQPADASKPKTVRLTAVPYVSGGTGEWER